MVCSRVASVLVALFLSGWAAAAGAPFTEEQICKAAIASIMGRDPSIMKITKNEKGVVALYYIRPDDKKKWTYRCSIKGARVLWAAENGRWRDNPADERITFKAKGDSLEIIQTYSDGSSDSEAFSRSHLSK